jgi:HAD superfamily hydrolase (TIGR01509 family)
MYQAVILDIDGTLVDSNDAHAQAWIDALAEGGRHVPFARVRPLIGMGGDKLLPQVTGIELDSPEGEALARRRTEIFQQKYLPQLRATRGAQRLLEHLRDEGLTLVVATSAQASEVRDLLQVAGATQLIDNASSSDDADNSKPDPDIVHAAVAKSGCPADAALMLGDTPYDIESAGRAGVATIALRCGGWDDRSLAGAIAIYDDPQDLLDRYLLSPFKQPAGVVGRP